MAIRKSKQLTDLWDFASDTTLVSKDGETEVGDSAQVDFYPQVKMVRWGNEANFSIRAVLSEINSSVDAQKSVITYSSGNIEVDFGWRDTSFAMPVRLLSRPATNTIDFTVMTKECSLHLQLPLTIEQIGRGDKRPVNVEHSLAVYSKKRGNEYKVGKICHLYRPQAIDSNGIEAWGEWSILDTDTIRITIPDTFLTTASYPVEVL